MQKSTWIFTLLLVFTLLLSACAGGEQDGSETVAPGAGDTGTQEGIPDTGAETEAVGEVTDMVEPTEAMETTEVVTEEASPTVEATEEMTATEEATEDATEASTPTTDAGDTGAATPTVAAETPGADGTPGAAQGLIGIPQTGSNAPVGLAAMMDWQVVGADGNEIGTVQDYVINICEAHILFLVVDPAQGLTADGGQQILIPYEAVLGELNEGSSVDVEQRVYTLKENAADLSGVPGVDINSADMENPDWSEEVLDYWSANYRVSLTAGCNVPVSDDQGAAGQNATQTVGDATPTADGQQADNRETIYRVALASEVLNAQLQEGNGRVLGTVQDIAITQQTGRTRYYVIETGETGQGAGRMVALPPGAVNISYENGVNQPVLVLLVETSLLQNAPEFDQNTTTTDDNWFNFWDQYIPMTREQLP